MGGDQFNRQAFVGQRERAPQRSSSLAGPLLLLAVLGVAGFGGYKYVQANGVPELGGGNSDLAQVVQKLEEVEKRLDLIEKRRRAGSGRASTPKAKKEPTPSNTTLSAPSPKKASQTLPPPPKQRGEVERSPGTAVDRSAPRQRQQFGSLRTELEASQEAWEATSDRLVNAVGEMGSQRNQIAHNRESLDELRGRFERTYHPFELHKSMGRQRVGPVWLRLKGTDRKRQRYTVRLFIDDKWTEMKDRALHEPVEFYLFGATDPIELVVSAIYNNRIMGYLLLPRIEKRR
jgi:hypothetical protein